MFLFNTCFSVHITLFSLELLFSTTKKTMADISWSLVHIFWFDTNLNYHNIKYFSEIKIMFALKQFHTIKRLHLWKKNFARILFCFHKKNDPPYILVRRYLSIYLRMFISIYLSISIFIYLFVCSYLSIYLSMSTFIYFLSLCVLIYLSHRHKGFLSFFFLSSFLSTLLKRRTAGLDLQFTFHLTSCRTKSTEPHLSSSLQHTSQN